ncbi:mucin-3B isoform X2 [Microcaecilia unicolor]|uniref:Mucin-3B-like isoform X2 n=1 Tax=Microcaecilia unicolor TaxID=1415580 RepID=A0A6P7WKW6_9AMPH|nr:mucin-3B-like isoform X2 [Microcaecilia unicolor]
MTCATKCVPGLKQSIDCNPGKCELLKSGPKCSCPNQDTYWYIGDRCKSKLDKMGIIAGFSTTVAVLLIVLLIVAFLWRRSQMKNVDLRMKSDSEEYGKWYEDAWESDSAEGFVVRNPEVLQWEEDTNSSFSKGNFRPSLEKVDTTMKVTIRRPAIAESPSVA